LQASISKHGFAALLIQLQDLVGDVLCHTRVHRGPEFCVPPFRARTGITHVRQLRSLEACGKVHGSSGDGARVVLQRQRRAKAIVDEVPSNLEELLGAHHLLVRFPDPHFLDGKAEGHVRVVDVELEAKSVEELALSSQDLLPSLADNLLVFQTLQRSFLLLAVTPQV